MIHRITYYIYDAFTDLPAYIAGTAIEAANFIGCCRASIYNIANKDIALNGYKLITWIDDPSYYPSEHSED